MAAWLNGYMVRWLVYKAEADGYYLTIESRRWMMGVEGRGWKMGNHEPE